MKKGRQKGKEVFTPCLCLSRILMHSSQLKISVTHKHTQQGCKHNRNRWQRSKQAQGQANMWRSLKNVPQWRVPHNHQHKMNGQQDLMVSISQMSFIRQSEDLLLDSGDCEGHFLLLFFHYLSTDLVRGQKPLLKMRLGQDHSIKRCTEKIKKGIIYHKLYSKINFKQIEW